jgi:hypothetical protein
MKKVLCLTLTALAFISTVAQSQVGVEFHLGGGITQPTGNFNDVAKLGWHGLATFAVVPSHAPFAIQASALYGENKFKAGSGKWKLFGGLGEVRLDLGTKGTSRGYFMAGGGAFNLKATGGGSSTKAAFDGGAGFAYLPSPEYGVFIEARYVNVFVSGPDIAFIPVTLGLRFTFK